MSSIDHLEEASQRRVVFHYLNLLRESGVTNMYGAAPYLRDRFGFDRQQSRDWLQHWMEEISRV